MAIPVQIQTRYTKILPYCGLPLLGGLLIVMIGMSLPSLLAFLGVWTVTHFEWWQPQNVQMQEDVWFACTGVLMFIYNLILVFFFQTKIKILFVPAWLLGLIIAVVQTLLLYGGKP